MSAEEQIEGSGGAKPMRLVIAGGGTGGHLFPGVAVAEEMRRRHDQAEITFVGTSRGIEARVLPELGWPLELIQVSGVKTVGLLGAIKGILRLPRALWQARRVLKRLDPDAVLGVGGYASFPVLPMARIGGRRTAILEQNSVPGLTNKLLGRVVHRIFVAFADSARFFTGKKTRVIGNPIRRRIIEAISEARGTGTSDAQPLRLFVCGGSQGAVAVNEVVCAAAALLRERGVELRIVHQTGEADLEATRARYAEAGIEAECHAFIVEMAREYARCQLVVARAGATTVAELAIAGVPAIFIPYPFAADNHQELNARAMVAAGAALMERQSELTAEKLAGIIAELARDVERRRAMASAMAAFGRPEAADRVIDFVVRGEASDP